MSYSCEECENLKDDECTAKFLCAFKPKYNKSDKDAQEWYGPTKIVDKEEEKKYLDKLVNDHWDYIEGVLYQALQYTGEATDSDTARIEEVEYHYKTAFKHGYGHAREYHAGETL